MGCVSSKPADSKANRVSRWRSTGIVALRDSKLKQTFPDEILDLDRVVRTVDLTHNKIVDVPVEINKLINMQRLILAENLIERLPMNLGKLQSLKVMTLDGNRLSGLPDELGQLVRLEQLSVSRNVLTYLPETLGSLRNLKLLNASNNQLKYLPESIGSCFSLEELQANDNSIDDLPPSVCNLIHLKSLSLDNNKVIQVIVNFGCPQQYLQTAKLCRVFPCTTIPFPWSSSKRHMEGFQEFESRRRKKFDKQIDSNVMMNSKGLDQGVDL
ncbi:Plant intracellular Ras-group-related LRR protein 7 [Bienertia sinuspersici]